MTALTVNKLGLQRALARARGWDPDPDNWNDTQDVDGPDIISGGLRRFYFPPPLPGERESHVWSFLRPLRTITVWPTVTGTIDSADATTITATAASFYDSMVGKTISCDDGDDYTITSVTSTTVVVVDGNPSAETGDFTITADGDYRLPDDFADVVGDLVFAVGANRYHTIRHRSLGQVLQRRASHSSSWNEQPEWFAIRPETFVEGTGQRHALMLQAIPDTTYVLSYKSAVEPDLVSASSYVRGGTPHVQTAIEAILAEAENVLGDELGVHEARFMERLATSVSFDRQGNAPDTFGPNVDRSDDVPDEWRSYRDEGTMDVFELFDL